MLIGAAIVVIGIFLGNAEIHAQVPAGVAGCGNAFSADTDPGASNFDFGSRDRRELSQICHNSIQQWRVFSFGAIGLGCAVLIGARYIRRSGQSA